MSTGTIVPGTAMLAGTNCDDCSVPLALPFPYTFYGQVFNSVNVISNGSLQFTSSDTSFTNTCEPVATQNNVIHVYWDDILMTTAGDGVYTSVSGSAPNRIMNIEWRGCYYSGGSCGAPVSVEARLYEGQSKVDVIYNQVSLGNSSATGGVQKDTGSLFLQAYCNGVGAAVNTGVMHTYSQPPCVTPTPGSPVATNTAGATATPCVGGQVILYDQLNNPGTFSTSSQEFEAANVAFNNQGADDFMVPAGETWNVNQVDAQGVYFNGPGPAASFHSICVVGRSAAGIPVSGLDDSGTSAGPVAVRRGLGQMPWPVTA